MSTNSQFAVGTHILALLAVYNGPLNSRMISQSVNTNPVVVRRIIGTLQAADLVETQMGVDGGTTLLRPSDQITLLNVYHATGQGSVLQMPANKPNPRCTIGAHILPTLTPVFDRAQQALEAELAAVTVADVAAGIRQRGERATTGEGPPTRLE